MIDWNKGTRITRQQGVWSDKSCSVNTAHVLMIEGNQQANRFATADWDNVGILLMNREIWVRAAVMEHFLVSVSSLKGISI